MIKKKNYEDILFNDLLYLSSPNYFNDPFDCSLELNFRGKSKRYVKNYLIKKILPLHINHVDENQKKKANFFIDEYFEDFNPNNKNVEQILKQNIRNFILKTGIYCLSELKDNILLWSHYAYFHKGFCIEFNYRKLEKALLEYNKRNSVITLIDRIIYKKIYPNLSGYNDDEMVDLMFIKSSNWKYEKEWRILYSDGSGKKINLPSNVITSIYLGMNINPENEVIINKAISLKSYRINLYKAIKVENKFKLSFERIN